MLDPLTLLALAVGLAMDSFAVSIALGVSLPRVRTNQALRLALAFGGFQFLMPVVGYLAGKSVAGQQWVADYDHWIAFGLLAALGAKMIRDAGTPDEDEAGTAGDGDPTKSPQLVVLALATSVDALAVGLSLALLHVTILLPSSIIGLTAAAFAIVGVHLGHRLGHHLERRAEVVGGLALIAIGLRILLEHLLGASG
ncbi:MAG: manganese efflux pump MntP family protein [Candidatus Sericytochromatia bacterium]|nr:manganese efflux pump MntP family protein [Candidatus Sericytochromatia bacterium]